MVLDKQGNPLVETKDRRDEIQRCIEIIGWGWGRLGDRLEVKLPTAYAIKNCKRPVADSDLRWLQALADAVVALPRPAEFNDPAPVQGAPVVQAGAAVMFGPPAPLPDVVVASSPPVDMVQRVRQEIAEESAVALVASITNVYLAARPGVGPDAMTSEQVAGARWALGELAQSLGVLDLVQDQLRAYQQQAAAEAPRVGVIGATPAPMQREPMA
jgi:hypothetical protein